MEVIVEDRLFKPTVDQAKEKEKGKEVFVESPKRLVPVRREQSR